MKNTFRRFLLSALCILTAVMMLVGCGGSASSAGSPAGGSTGDTPSAGGGAESGEKKTVKVAVMCPMSGETSRFGQLYKAGIEAAMKVVEEDGMLQNYTLEFEYIDDKGTTDGAPPAATYALDQYGCDIAIGHMLTTMVLADGQYFEDAEVPLIGIVSGPASVSQGWEYLCIATGTDLSQADTLIDYLVGQGCKNISLINVNTEGGMSAADEIESYLDSKYSLSLATHEQMTMDDVDFTSVALNMKNAGTDCVIFWGLPQAAGQLCYTAVRQYCGDDVLFAGGSNLAQSQMTSTWNEDDVVGVVFPVGYIPDPSNPLQPRICQYFTEADPDHTELADVPARVVDSIFHIVTALNNMGAQDPDADDFSVNLNTALRSASFDGVQGHFDFSANDNGVGLNEMNIGVWGEGFTQSKAN